jgi:LmbE family N-acetylglucosaminyl deacetylase
MTPDPARGVVLHVSPHPDDELLGAPAALMAVRDAGSQVVNFVISLGRRDDHRRRRAEVEEAAARAGFEIVIADPPVAISRGDDLARAETEIRRLVESQLQERQVRVVVAPSPHDRHHGHEVVARGVREALRRRADSPMWWMWGLWGALPFPSVFVPFDDARREEITEALAAHAGETARNDYRRLVAGRAQANAVLGAELVFGFGASGRESLYADLLSEVIHRDGGWWLGKPREFDRARPFDTEPSQRADAWVDAPSLSQLACAWPSSPQ